MSRPPRRDRNRWPAPKREPPPWVGKPIRNATDEWRTHLHDIFDQLWQNGPKRRFNNRAAAYAWLASVLGKTDAECHIRNFDVDTCRKAVDACRSLQ